MKYDTIVADVKYDISMLNLKKIISGNDLLKWILHLKLKIMIK